MDKTIPHILETCKTLAVVGLSSDASRPSHGVSAYMQLQGYRIIPVNPNEREVLGEKAYASLDEVPGPVDAVVIFRRPMHVPEVVEGAIRKGAKAVWMQEGITHPEGAERARSAGLAVVENRCILKEHARWSRF
jgi:predicted CoA-binding protein